VIEVHHAANVTALVMSRAPVNAIDVAFVALHGGDQCCPRSGGNNSG